MKRIRGLINLAFDLVDETTKLVESTHLASADRFVRRWALIRSNEPRAQIETAIQPTMATGVCQAIRAVNAMTRVAVNAGVNETVQQLEGSDHAEALTLATPVRSTAAGTASWYLDYLQSGLNGFLGDYLKRNSSELELGMSVWHHGRQVAATREAFGEAFPDCGNKICIFVHGLCGTEWLWSLSSEEHYGETDVTFGTRLECDLGYMPIYVRYNTGLRVAENGRALSTLLTEIIGACPTPIEEICIVGYSMGGLVARSAAHYANEQEAPWLQRLRHVVCIGSPHQGSPHAKAADLLYGIFRNLDAAAPQVLAELLHARSEGIQDLQHGTIVDEAWEDEKADPGFPEAERTIPRVDGVGYSFVAATVTHDPEHPLGHLLGDLIVRLPSAAGDPSESDHRLPFHGGTVLHGLHHFDLTNHPEVYEAVRDQIAAGTAATER